LLQTIEITVTGKVQGVFYRQTTKEIALQLGVSGYVKNLSNGDVYIKATATKELLDQLCDYCKTGPAKANVSSIKTKEIPLEEFSSFRIER
jgi:acylphosphatase